MNKLNLTWQDIYLRLDKITVTNKRIYGIPRGGAIVAGLLALKDSSIEIVNNPLDADIAIDDIIDSGRTSTKLKKDYGLDTVALVNKSIESLLTTWVHFPWEESPEKDSESIVNRFLEYIGEDLSRNGILETPNRVVKSWDELFSGYNDNPDKHLKWFNSDSDEMVICKNINFYSMCEHHVLPFFGTVSIGYVPKGKVVGVSKLSRAVNSISRRLQIQENMTQQIGKVFEPYVKGVAVSVKAQHLCTMMRGVSQQNNELVTNYVSGVFRENPETRQEFFNSI